LAKQNIETYKTKVQTETIRRNPRQVDRVLLTNTVSQQTIHKLETALPNTVLTLETWPHMLP
jgi:hypothetical protein